MRPNTRQTLTRARLLGGRSVSGAPQGAQNTAYALVLMCPLLRTVGRDYPVRRQVVYYIHSIHSIHGIYSLGRGEGNGMSLDRVCKVYAN